MKKLTTAALAVLLPGVLLAGDFKMPQLPEHPRLLLTAAQIPAIKTRIEADAVLHARFAAMIKQADGWLKKPVELPARGGQWWHYYTCDVDGARLVTVSSTTHRCPVCGKVFSGWPYDDVILSGVHSGYSGQVRDLGFLYALTGNAAYAARAREILLAYAAKYSAYPLHNIQGKAEVGGGHVMPQTLDEASWLIPMCQGADLIWNYLSPSERKTMEDGLIRPAAQTIMRHKMKIHNIQCWKNSAVGLAGLLLGDSAMLEDALASDHGFYAQMAQGINADGQWYEGAWGYHFFMMNAVAPLAVAGANCGLDLFGYTANGQGGPGSGRGYRDLFLAPLKLAMPDKRLPGFNDSDYAGILAQAPIYELALAHYGDAELAEVLRAAPKRDSLYAMISGVYPLPQPKTQTLSSRNYPSAGYAILQNGNDSGATWLCLKYGPHGGGHGHPDKLNFILYSSGTVLGFDPGTGPYAAPIHGQWRKTTIAHNTLTVDEENQSPATGKDLAFVSSAAWSGILADAGPIYPGVTYRRAAALVGHDLVIVLDMASADKEHTFDFAYHNTGEWATPLPGKDIAMPDKIGYKYLHEMKVVDGALPPVKNGVLTENIAVAMLRHGDILAGIGAGTFANEKVPCVIARIKGSSAAAAWAITLDGVKPDLRIEANGDVFSAVVKINGKTYRLVAAPDTLKLE